MRYRTPTAGPSGCRPPSDDRKAHRDGLRAGPEAPHHPNHRGGIISTPPYTPQEVEAATERAAALLTEALDPSGPAEDAIRLMVHAVGQLLENPEAIFEQITETWMGSHGQTPDQIRGWWNGW